MLHVATSLFIPNALGETKMTLHTETGDAVTVRMRIYIESDMSRVPREPVNCPRRTCFKCVNVLAQAPLQDTAECG